MKRHIVIPATWLILFTLALAGCSTPAGLLPASAPPSQGSPPEQSLASSPARPTPETTEPENGETTSEYQTEYGDWYYYLDTGNTNKGSNGEQNFALHRKKKSGSEDENLGIACSRIFVCGDHLYVNMETEGAAIPHWDTYRVNPDGTGKEPVGKDIQIQYTSPESIYYTTYEGAIYKTDLDFKNVQRYPITPPEERDPLPEVKKMIKTDPVIQISYLHLEDGKLRFTYELEDGAGNILFTGYYTMKAGGGAAERGDGGSWYTDSRVYLDGWIYYFDIDNPMEDPGSGENYYYIHRMKQDGSGDKNLKVKGFRFDMAGRYLYADENLSFGDFGHWDTYRYNQDGSGRKKLKYGDMERFSKDGKLYFSLFNESAFYISDTKCENVKKMKVKVPDEKAIQQKLDYPGETFVHVYDARDGWVYFEYEITDEGPSTLYCGHYRIQMTGGNVEKVDTGFYSEDSGE